MKQNVGTCAMPEESIDIYEDFADFCCWFQDLMPEDTLDLQEAATIYFNLETYIH